MKYEMATWRRQQQFQNMWYYDETGDLSTHQPPNHPPPGVLQPPQILKLEPVTNKG